MFVAFIKGLNYLDSFSSKYCLFLTFTRSFNSIAVIICSKLSILFMRRFSIANEMMSSRLNISISMFLHLFFTRWSFESNVESFRRAKTIASLSQKSRFKLFSIVTSFGISSAVNGKTDISELSIRSSI